MLRPAGQSILDWFDYVDRERHFDPAAGWLKTHDFTHDAEHDPFHPSWQKEEWKVTAVLVPIDTEGREEAFEHAFGADYLHPDETYSPSWEDEKTFKFADITHEFGLDIWPWIQNWEHPTRHVQVIVPRADFLLYHGLDQVQVSDGSDYVHATENSCVLRTRRREVAHFAEMPFVEVQRDYLRDYLFARKAIMLITVVADRFANALTSDELHIQDADVRVSNSAWIQKNLYDFSATDGYFRGRSSLYWNVAIRAFKSPRIARSIWPFYGLEPPADDEQPYAPHFKMDAEGTLEKAAQATNLRFYYFRPAVLQRYLDDPSYKVSFHMRTWGSAESPSGSVVAGINSKGLVTAYARDIAKLRESEQLHWAAYNVVVDGEVCYELFETQMQQNPPHSPNVVELVGMARKAMRDALTTLLGVDCFRDHDLDERRKMRLTVGPVIPNESEVQHLAQTIYDWLIDPLAFGPLRDYLSLKNLTFDNQERQISLLQKVIATRVGEERAKALVAPLRMVGHLRVQAAHPTDSDVATELKNVGITQGVDTPRGAYMAMVDRLAKGLVDIAAALA